MFDRGVQCIINHLNPAQLQEALAHQVNVDTVGAMLPVDLAACFNDVSVPLRRLRPNPTYKVPVSLRPIMGSKLVRVARDGMPISSLEDYLSYVFCSKRSKRFERLDISLGADVNYQLSVANFDDQRQTALGETAKREDSLPQIRFLLARGADPNAHPSIIGCCHPSHYETLIQAGADVFLATQKGNTPLHFACKQGGHRETIGKLIESGADHKQANKSGEQPIKYVANNVELATFIRATVKRVQRRAVVQLRAMESRVEALEREVKAWKEERSRADAMEGAMHALGEELRRLQKARQSMQGIDEELDDVPSSEQAALERVIAALTNFGSDCAK